MDFIGQCEHGDCSVGRPEAGGKSSIAHGKHGFQQRPLPPVHSASEHHLLAQRPCCGQCRPAAHPRHLAAEVPPLHIARQGSRFDCRCTRQTVPTHAARTSRATACAASAWGTRRRPAQMPSAAKSTPAPPWLWLSAERCCVTAVSRCPSGSAAGVGIVTELRGWAHRGTCVSAGRPHENSSCVQCSSTHGPALHRRARRSSRRQCRRAGAAIAGQHQLRTGRVGGTAGRPGAWLDPAHRRGGGGWGPDHSRRNASVSAGEAPDRCDRSRFATARTHPRSGGTHFRPHGVAELGQRVEFPCVPGIGLRPPRVAGGEWQAG